MAGEEVTSSPGESTNEIVTVADLSGQGLQKLSTSLPCGAETRTLILDKNQIIKLEHLEKCKNLTQLSVANNRLVRMMGVSKLVHLRVLNLPHNSIGYVEGLKDLVHLEWINLAGNNLKVIDQINNCTSLQHLDLSDNNISQIGDLSKLLCLKTLLLHGNNITSLRTASTSLPHNLSILSLAENEIRDLNEVSFLASLSELEQLSIMNNPCVMATPSIPGFDYRPYIVSWCLNLKVLDGYIVSQKESLKAEWLYSQGKGRSYRPGQHVPLVQYLASVCPLTSAHGLQTEEDAKLEKILCKQRLHQRQLMHQIPNETHLSSTPSKRSYSSAEQQSPTRSLHRSHNSEPVVNVDTWLGTSNSEDRSYTSRNVSSSPHSGPSHYHNLYLEDIQTDEDKLNCSLLSSESTFMPVAPGLSPVSPTAELRVPGITNDVSANNTVTEMSKGISENLDEKETKVGTTGSSFNIQSTELLKEYNSYHSSCDSVTEYIQQSSASSSYSDTVDGKALQMQDKDTDRLRCMNNAATKLQSYWRGFYARKHNSKVKEVRYEIRLSRMQEHIVYLSQEVCRLKKERDEERMQRLVQEEALQYLWDQVRSIQEWQNKVSDQIYCFSKSDVLPSGVSAAQHSSSNESAPKTSSRKTTPDIPDSGFHSINIEQTSHPEMSSSEQSSTVGSGSSEQSLETVKHYEQPLPNFIEDHETTAQDHSEHSKDDSIIEQDNSLLQQYLDTVQQLEQAEDNTSLSDVTEESRPEVSNSSVYTDSLSSSFSHDCEDGKKLSVDTREEVCQSSEAPSLLATQDTCTEEPEGEYLQ
ncbi:centrosomal protein of 97 kDa isoform X2 [Hyla sarda]|uniref:centrosomal protein of 97 kDa isoform X2 n=1 Tax=Hyla sarda TaxID=327740 RepID=UPI0024C27C60|nr:centrosomal protein of 97 kDa isoform X2 [Hyla sarda]